MSYDDSDLSELNTARAALGDTSNDEASELLTDDHIEIVIGQYGYNLGVATLADELAVRFAQDPSSVGLPSNLSVAWSERVAEYRRIALRYRALATQASAVTTSALTSRAATVAVW